MTLNREDLRNTTRHGRNYIWPPGDPNAEEYVSVTTALGDGIPKPALMYWAAKMVATTAVEQHDFIGTMIETQGPDATIQFLKGAHYRSSGKAADIGSTVHDIAEKFASGAHYTDLEEMITEIGDKVGEGKARQVLAFFEQINPKVIAVEAVVYSRQHSYAGTLDFILEIDHEDTLRRLGWFQDRPMRVLVDLKTGKGVYPEVCLQLAAYANADFMASLDIAEEKVPDVDGGLVLHVSSKSWSLYPCDIGPDAFAAFLAALSVARTQERAGDLLGKPAVRGRA